MKRIILISGISSLFIVNQASAQIAAAYNGDAGIQTNTNVIFTEMFEGMVSPLSFTSSGNWNQMTSNLSNIVFDTSIPPGSPGSKSLKLITKDDNTNQNENTFIYKKISPDITDSVFVRFYIKYDNATEYHHSGVYIGGKNPPSPTAGLVGGVLVQGNQEFHVGAEIRGAANNTPTNTSTFGFYNYWMNMKPSAITNTNTNQPYYYGNQFLNSTTNDDISMSSWNCIEVMVKLNNPVTAYNGELALWVNGVKINHYGYNFPTGTWNYGNFTEGAGTPFEGYQWRNDAALNLNYLWLKNFNDNNPVNHIGTIYFDHLVVAKSYIGPMGNGVGIKEQGIEDEIRIFPNPTMNRIKINTGTQQLKKVVVYNLSGQIVVEGKSSEYEIEDLSSGMYFVSIQTEESNYIKKIIKN